jgi:hypothetical protein
MDMFVEQTHDLPPDMRNNDRPPRFTDTRIDEQQRAISLKSVPMTLVSARVARVSGEGEGASIAWEVAWPVQRAWVQLRAHRCCAQFQMSSNKFER